MERLIRKPFQGIKNILKFNWHFYAFAFLSIAFLIFSIQFSTGNLKLLATLTAIGASISVLSSLAVSFYVYDCSHLYRLDWLNFLAIKPNAQLATLNAGFDETSALLSQKFPTATLFVFDFYNPALHTERSIRRARKAYPAFIGTQTIQTNAVPLKENSIDSIFLLFSAHEIRNDFERIAFFKKLKQSLKEDGKIVVVEHLRDGINFMAYTIGFFHFLSKNTWKETFQKASLSVETTFTITPFITTFILRKNGATT